MSLISYDVALARVQAVAPLDGAETVPLDAAHGRVLSADIVARSGAPRQAVSTMDGYAIAGAAQSADSWFAIIGESRPGRRFAGAVSMGEAVRIFTGGALPAGADRVVVQERATREAGRVRFADGIATERFWRAADSDFSAGAVLVARGTRLNPRALVAAAAGDVATAMVARRPRVAIIATGDELVAAGAAAQTAEAIPDSLTPALSAFVRDHGGEVTAMDHCPDDLARLQDAARRACAVADLVIVTGGASVGAHDHARAMFGDGLRLLIDKVAIRPGRPVWLGTVGTCHVLGLPGNPTSALVTAALFLRPLLMRLQGGTAQPQWRRIALAAALPPGGERERFVRARWEAEGLVPLGNQDSGAQAPLVDAEWLIRCAPHQGARLAGEMVEAMEF